MIGSRLTARLAERGDEVHALVRDPSSAPPEAAAVVVHDLEQPLEPGAVPEVDTIVHLAHHPLVTVPEHATRLHRVNALSTQELLEAGRRTGARRFVYASSGAVYQPSEVPLQESNAQRANDLYALSKLHGEEFVRAYADYLEPVIVRPFFPYGPGQSGRLVSNLIDTVRAGRPVLLRKGGRPRCNPIFVDDAVLGFIAALDGPAPNVVNVGGEDVVTIGELAAAVGRAVGTEPSFEHVDGEVEGDYVADITRMRSLLGPKPLVTLGEGLKRTVG